MSNPTRRDFLVRGGAWLGIGVACVVVGATAAAAPTQPEARLQPGTQSTAGGHDHHAHAGKKSRKRMRIKAKRKDKDNNSDRVFELEFDESDTAIDGVTVDGRPQDFQVMKDEQGVSSHLRPFDEPYRTSEVLMAALIEYYEFSGFAMD